jgi:hypothetical protein
MSYQQNQPSDKIQVAVFPNNGKKNEKSPDFQGEVSFPDGKKMEISLWRNSYADPVSGESLPYLKGNIADKWIPPAGQQRSAPRQQQSNSVKIDF